MFGRDPPSLRHAGVWRIPESRPRRPGARNGSLHTFLLKLRELNSIPHSEGRGKTKDGFSGE